MHMEDTYQSIMHAELCLFYIDIILKMRREHLELYKKAIKELVFVRSDLTISVSLDQAKHPSDVA